jgi:hypothetical protein
MQSRRYQPVIEIGSERYRALSGAYLAAIGALSACYQNHRFGGKIVIKICGRKSARHCQIMSCDFHGRAKSVIKIDVIAGISRGGNRRAWNGVSRLGGPSP